jgi:hypothetical protein
VIVSTPSSPVPQPPHVGIYDHHVQQQGKCCLVMIVPFFVRILINPRSSVTGPASGCFFESSCRMIAAGADKDARKLHRTVAQCSLKPQQSLADDGWLTLWRRQRGFYGWLALSLPLLFHCIFGAASAIVVRAGALTRRCRLLQRWSSCRIGSSRYRRRCA